LFDGLFRIAFLPRRLLYSDLISPALSWRSDAPRSSCLPISMRNPRIAFANCVSTDAGNKLILSPNSAVAVAGRNETHSECARARMRPADTDWIYIPPLALNAPSTRTRGLDSSSARIHRNSRNNSQPRDSPPPPPCPRPACLSPLAPREKSFFENPRSRGNCRRSRVSQWLATFVVADSVRVTGQLSIKNE